ncbi:hypothetical protein VMCG_01900 [Cytospora schulzeri]|uniref:Uncharacterized protein n=1 Tax=Cytospora schulzeri TaxID=448051 RepID=A0A423X319_9PEZI|nr:hypothetical protein VMCG_01900 [Valsa malicola]
MAAPWEIAVFCHPYSVLRLQRARVGPMSPNLTMDTNLSVPRLLDYHSLWAISLDKYGISAVVLLANLVLATCIYFSPRQRLVSGIPFIGGASMGESVIGSASGVTPRRYSRRATSATTSTVAFYVPELKTAPVDKVDFPGTFVEMFEGKYTTFGSRSALHPRTFKTDLNKNLAGVMMELQDEVVDCFGEIFPDCSEEKWTEVTSCGCRHTHRHARLVPHIWQARAQP